MLNKLSFNINWYKRKPTLVCCVYAICVTRLLVFFLKGLIKWFVVIFNLANNLDLILTARIFKQKKKYCRGKIGTSEVARVKLELKKSEINRRLKSMLALYNREDKKLIVEHLAHKIIDSLCIFSSSTL